MYTEEKIFYVLFIAVKRIEQPMRKMENWPRLKKNKMAIQ